MQYIGLNIPSEVHVHVLWFRMKENENQVGIITLKPKTVFGSFGCNGYIQYLHTTVGGGGRVSRIKL